MTQSIYFAGSIRGGREDVEWYGRIIPLLKKYGEVLTEHVGDKTLALMGEDGITDAQIYERDIKWLQRADTLVAEVTSPSLGVGSEIGCAVQWKKRILCIHRPMDGKRLSAMIAGCPNISHEQYSTIEDLERILGRFFERTEHYKPGD